ncbi:MAG: hypothetical protein ACI9EF_000675, partial [Pseudohongiellaceae bacterium]
MSFHGKQRVGEVHFIHFLHFLHFIYLLYFVERQRLDDRSPGRNVYKFARVASPSSD